MYAFVFGAIWIIEVSVDHTKYSVDSKIETRWKRWKVFVLVFYFCSAQCKKTFDSDPHKYGHPK